MTNFTKTIVICKPIELVTQETAQMTDFLKGFLNVIDFDRFLLDLNPLRMIFEGIFSSPKFEKNIYLFLLLKYPCLNKRK